MQAGNAAAWGEGVFEGAKVLSRSSQGGIWRNRGVYVNVQAAGDGNAGGIAISVAVVVGASSGYVRPFWRLRDLPDFRKVDAALCRARRAAGKRASGRRRARVICDPVNDSPRSGILANVFSSDNAAVIFGGMPEQ